MNENPGSVSDYSTQVDECIRENPTRAILAALGAGLVIGLAIRALQPPPPSTRAARLIEDLQDHLHDLTDRVTSLAGDGVERVRDLGIESNVRSLGQRVRGLFH